MLYTLVLVGVLSAGIEGVGPAVDRDQIHDIAQRFEQHGRAPGCAAINAR